MTDKFNGDDETVRRFNELIKGSEKLNDVLEVSKQFKKMAGIAGLDKIAEQVKFASSAQTAIKNAYPSSLNLDSLSALRNYELPPVALERFKPPSQAEINHFQSAGVLLKRLASTIAQWRKTLPVDGTAQPAVLAILQGGVQIEVDTLAEESFHGIRIEGKLDGAPCMVLAHQSTTQLICFIQKIEPPDRPPRQIGFVVDGESWKT